MLLEESLDNEILQTKEKLIMLLSESNEKLMVKLSNQQTLIEKLKKGL